MKKLLCIDGNSILNRQFYGIRYLSTKDGFPTNAIYGMISVISKQLEAISPDYSAVAFDLKAPTFRHIMYDAYKAGRHAMPDDLARQLPVAKEICRAMGFTVIELEGYEADDILGTLAQMASDSPEETETYILTGDRDSLQLINSHVKVLLATNAETVTMDEDAFYEKYGVRAHQYVDVKALMGDSSDNIPGVLGIGEKTAFKLISESGNLDNLYENINTLKVSSSIRTKLEVGKESAYLSKTLSEIKCDVPLGITLLDIENHGIDRKKAKELFVQYEMMGALKKFGLDKPDCGTPSSSSEKPSVRQIDAEELSELDGSCYAVYLSENKMSISDGRTVWMLGEIDNRLPKFLNSVKIICWDCKSLYKALEEKQIHWRGAYFDVMLGAYVDDSAQGAYTLERLCSAYLGETYDALNPRAWYISRMWKIIETKLRESEQLSLLNNIEMPLAGVLCNMEITGFKIDGKGIENYGAQLDESARELEQKIYASAGEHFNINSPKQLGEILFEKLMLPSGKKTKTGYSTSAEVLEKLKKYHPIIDDILEYRQLTKLKSTYVDGLLKGMDSEGRVHTHFNQTGTATGRLSSTDPNLQNIPIRTETGRQFRKFFVSTDASHVLIDADYSQIELRLLAHISDDADMKEAFSEGGDIHMSTACRIFGVTPNNVTIEMRKKAKAINFGILYGMGDFSLADDLKISRAKAKSYIQSYLDSYPGIEKYLTEVVEKAKNDGYVTTMFGRRRYIPELSANNKNIRNFGERVARNSPIQGSSADIIKIAMINVERRLKESGTGARLLLQVHDELLVETPKSKADEVLHILKEEMENAVRLSVPLAVEANIGKNWYECH